MGKGIELLTWVSVVAAALVLAEVGSPFAALHIATLPCVTRVKEVWA